MTLSPQEAHVHRLLHGLDYPEEGMNLREIGEIFDRSKEAIRLIQNKALKKLRRICKKNMALRNIVDSL